MDKKRKRQFLLFMMEESAFQAIVCFVLHHTGRRCEYLFGGRKSRVSVVWWRCEFDVCCAMKRDRLSLLPLCSLSPRNKGCVFAEAGKPYVLFFFSVPAVYW
jgi:hypothetical protein